MTREDMVNAFSRPLNRAIGLVKQQVEVVERQDREVKVGVTICPGI